MIFGLIVLILVGAIAYFHYVQGFFSATLSMILAIVAAVVAFSYHEVIVRALLKGKFADEANALVLVVLFAATYGILRIIFDKAIPGNIRLPVLLDKIGAAAAGLVAGIFAIGIFAIAAQTLPFGPSIAGYSRYQVIDHENKQVPGERGGQMTDTAVYDVLKSDKFDDPTMASRLIIPVDDIVVNTTAHLSDGGSLAGPQNLDQVHPSYLDEAFGQRLGIQTGAKHVAYNFEGGEKQVELRGVYELDRVATAPGEGTNIRTFEDSNFKPLVSTDQDTVLVTRLFLSRNASDADNNIRISTASVRLVANGKDYIPLGTLDQSAGAPIVRLNKPDDFLIVASDGVVDFVFQVPADALGLSGKKNEPQQIAPNVFMEVKRLAYVDLSGKQVQPEPPPPLGDKDAKILRKANLPLPKDAAVAAAAAPAADNAPFRYLKIEVSPTLFTQIEVGGHEGDNADVTFTSGKGILRDKKFARLIVDPTESIARMRIGDHLVGDLWAPPGARVVQVTGTPPPKSSSGWEWADKFQQFDLTDTRRNSYKPHGAIAKVKVGTSDHLLARYDAESGINDIPGTEGRPTDVVLIFVIPENTSLRQFRFDGKLVKAVNVDVK